MDVFEHIVDKVIVVLDGVVASSSRPHGAFPFDDELPHYSLCMPGRVLSQDVLFGMNEGNPLSYISMDFLTDCCMATFDHRFFLGLYEADAAFGRKVNESAVMIMFDQTKYAGIMRSEGAYAKVVLLLKALASCRVCLPERHIADILACDRTTVSRAGARIRREFPDLWERYLANKNRRVEMLYPRESLPLSADVRLS